ncbi:PAS domain-containing protein [[Mycobacterium] wendilense]|uniref:PAS domain-containing protein n=1 Tax=[Mycobacterium] wendilense TaxID=3064284 RepID=A0ABN9P7G3_9MYCO|nr:PAS domain-containing protein [Mycolicibacterium sp. MU0050]CAJ1585772.1 PAS domain-containing protein [Mycolicibacterium sp. MU0050]
MATRASGEPIRGLIVTALAECDRPMSTSELRRRLAVDFDVYVLTETLYRSLSILQRRGAIAKIDGRGRCALWVLNTEDPGDDGVGADERVPAGRHWPERGWQTGTDCLKVLRTDGVLLHVNNRGREVLGLDDDEEEFGMPWLDLLPSHIRSQGLRSLQRAVEGHRSGFAGVTFKPDGTPQYWDNTLIPLEGDDGRIREILCISRDVTPHVREGGTGPHQPRPHFPGSPPRRRRGGAVADRLNRLFSAIRAPDGTAYTNTDVLRALADRGVYISAPYLSQLRHGNRKRPSEATVDALADFFGVRPVYFADTYDEEDLQYLVRLDSDLHWLELAQDPDVRRLTTLMLGLSPEAQHELGDYLDRLAR